MSEARHPWWDPHRPAGFRLSPFDALLLLSSVPLTWLLWERVDAQTARVWPIVVGHFFLFCNVFRVWRWAEIVWGGVLAVNLFVWGILDAFTWTRVLLTQTPFTIVTLMTAFLMHEYRGVGFAFFRSLHRRRHHCL